MEYKIKKTLFTCLNLWWLSYQADVKGGEQDQEDAVYLFESMVALVRLLKIGTVPVWKTLKIPLNSIKDNFYTTAVFVATTFITSLQFLHAKDITAT